MTHQLAAAFLTAVLGFVGNFVSVVMWAASTGTDVAPWLSGGGAAAAVGGLAYIAKKIAAGELVAVPLARLLDESARREDRLIRLIEDSQEREEALRALLFSRELRNK